MITRWIVLSIIFILLFLSPLYAESFTGICTEVLDGDTITVDWSGKKITVRLYGSDCPEEGQEFNDEARHFTESLVLNKTVWVDVKRPDYNGRRISRVLADGKDIAIQLLKSGMAWFDGRQCNDMELKKAEESARNNKIGIWQKIGASAPWDYRRSNAGIIPEGSTTEEIKSKPGASREYGFIEASVPRNMSSFGIHSVSGSGGSSTRSYSSSSSGTNSSASSGGSVVSASSGSSSRSSGCSPSSSIAGTSSSSSRSVSTTPSRGSSASSSRNLSTAATTAIPGQYSSGSCDRADYPQKTIFDEKQKTVFDTKQKSIFDEKQKTVFDTKQKSIFDEKQKTVFDTKQKSVFDEKQKTVFDTKQKTIFDEKQKTVFDTKQKTIFDEKQKTVFDTKQKTIFDEKQKSVLDKETGKVNLPPAPHQYYNEYIYGMPSGQKNNMRSNGAMAEYVAVSSNGYYHKPTCKGARSAATMTKADAAARGYKPCWICKP
ncbi:MAG: thermonuclease family protein [Candidatus Xenobiia bacterium LiM19]